MASSNRSKPRVAIDPSREQIEQLKPREFEQISGLEKVVDSQDSEIALTEPEVITVGARFSNVQEEELAFMEERLIITILSSGQKNEENPVPVSVQGRQVQVWRETKTIVKRKYVERLARAKPAAIGSEQYMHGDERRVRYPSSRGLQYPFTVNKDPNPKGPQWLADVLQEN